MRVLMLLKRVRPPYLAGLAVLLAALSVPMGLRKSGDWDNVYLPAAKRLVAGEFIFRDGFVYPPANALLPLPVVALPRSVGVIGWYAISAVALLWLVYGAWRLSRAVCDDNSFRHHQLILLTGMICGLPFAFDCLSNRQSDLIVAGLIITGCLALQAGRSIRSAVWFGLAAGLKCTPLLWAPYLVLRRRFMAAAIVVAVAVSINVVPDVLFPPTNGSRLVQWARVFLEPVATGDREIGVWASAPINNHSLAGAGYRWLMLERISTDGHSAARFNPKVAPATLRLLTYGSDVALLFAAAAVLWRCRGASVDVLDYCLVLPLMLLLSPQSSKPHFCTLILPAFCLARLASSRRNATLGIIIVLAAGGALLSNKDLWGTTIYEAAMWYSSVFLTTLLLFAGCLSARWLSVSRPVDMNQVAGEIRPSHGLDAVA